MKKKLYNIVLVMMFVVGFSVMLYPSFSHWWNQKRQSRAVVDYDKALENVEEKDFTAYFQAAEAYNEELRNLPYPFIDCKELEGYKELLSLPGESLMGYITIEKIKIQLPIYHGTSNAVISVAVGHMEGTSLPTGGEGNHVALSSHRGLPTARLFTDLDKLVVGDEFKLKILDRVMTYEIDNISVVLPEEVTGLKMEEGKDYCTLVTCTPYAINTHRMLVRGVRVENRDESAPPYIASEAILLNPTAYIPLIVAIVLLIICLLILIRKKKKKKKHGGTGDEEDHA